MGENEETGKSEKIVKTEETEKMGEKEETAKSEEAT